MRTLNPQEVSAVSGATGCGFSAVSAVLCLPKSLLSCLASLICKPVSCTPPPCKPKPSHCGGGTTPTTPPVDVPVDR